MSDTLAGSDVEILSRLEESLSDDIPCDAGDGECSNTASHRMICPCKMNWENVCPEHLIEVRTNPFMVIVFTNTCKHTVIAAQLEIVPI